MEDDYEITRRRQAEERRRQREEERKKRREMLGLSKIRDVASNISNTSEIENNSDSSPILLSRKRIRRTDFGRIEKLKEEKQAEEGLRLIQEMYGSSYLNADALMNSPTSHSSYRVTERCESSRIQNNATVKNRGESFKSRSATRKQKDELKCISSTDKFCTVDDGSYDQKNISQTNRKNVGNPLASFGLCTKSNNDSSSDEDIVELARILQAKKRRGVSDNNVNNSSVKKIAPSDEERNVDYSYDASARNDDSDEDQWRSRDRVRRRDKTSLGNHRKLSNPQIEESSVTKSKKCALLEKDQDSESEEDLVSILCISLFVTLPVFIKDEISSQFLCSF
jgi:hypothetical protein